MRLVCPNCEAKYEVPDDAIPDTGRDVQCANCGHAWFQMRPRAATAPLAAATAEPEPEPVAEAGAAAEEPVAEAASAEPDVVAQPDTETPAADVGDAVPPEEVKAPLATEGEAEAEVVASEADAKTDQPDAVVADAAAEPEVDVEEDPEPDPQAAVATAASAYAVDESVLAILREEAEREANARRAEAQALESQTDLGLDSLAVAKAPVPEPEPDLKPSARRDLLPDVEEINSTLRPSEATGSEEAGSAELPPSPEPRRGFRSGFLTVMTAAILAAAVYLAAPQIGRLVPSLEGPLAGFVGFVDGLRLQLDGMMRSATVAINGG